jgi:hypothetical protein
MRVIPIDPVSLPARGARLATIMAQQSLLHERRHACRNAARPTAPIAQRSY